MLVNSHIQWLLPFKSNCLLSFLNSSSFASYNKWQRYSDGDLAKYSSDEKVRE